MHEYALPTTGGGSGYRQQQQLQQLQQEYAHEYSQEYTPPSRAGRSNDYTPGDYGGDYAADYAGGDYANEYQTEYQQPHVNGPPPPLPSRRGNSHQTRLAGTTPSSAIMAANPQLTPVVLPSFPTSLRAGSGATYSPYSPSRFHIDKRCQHRCSWKCCSLALILLCVVLTGMLAYFGVGSMRPGLDPSGCSINVQDNKDAVRDEASLGLAPSQTSPTEESLPTSTAVQYASASSRAPADTPDRPPDLPSIQQQQQQQQQQPPLQPLQP
ncbi:teneurin-a-like, partial [Thrips palmi]|uniref:Teneurin-a-like n=1 Tax=Thrips palmi TaxID=161013 RepID=A0A6P8YLD5_THRPL